MKRRRVWLIYLQIWVTSDTSSGSKKVDREGVENGEPLKRDAIGKLDGERSLHLFVILPEVTPSREAPAYVAYDPRLEGGNKLRDIMIDFASKGRQPFLVDSEVPEEACELRADEVNGLL